MLRTILAVGTFLSLLVLAGGQSVVRAAPDPFEINVIISITGPGAFLGQSEVQALTLLEAHTNKNGGINGRPIKFVIADDQTNPQTALQLAGALINAKVPIIFGPSVTAGCLAVAAAVVKTGPIEYCLSPGIQPTPGSFVYSATVSLRDDAVAMVRYLKARGFRRLGELASTDASGQALEQGYDAALALPENKGMEIVVREHMNPADLSASAQIARIKTANPEALLSWATGTTFGTLLRNLHDDDVNIPIVGGNGAASQTQLMQYSGFIPKELLFSGRRAMVPETSAPLAIRAAQARYFTAFREANIQTSFLTMLAWDPAMIYLDAIKRLGFNATAAQVNDYIQHLHGWAGIHGYYDFRSGSQRGIGIDGSVVHRWDPVKAEFVAVSKPAGFLR